MEYDTISAFETKKFIKDFFSNTTINSYKVMQSWTFRPRIHKSLIINEAFYFESGYLGRGFHALNIENCDSMFDSLDFLSPEMDQNYPKASIAIIAIKHFSLLYNLTLITMLSVGTHAKH